MSFNETGLKDNKMTEEMKDGLTEALENGTPFRCVIPHGFDAAQAIDSINRCVHELRRCDILVVTHEYQAIHAIQMAAQAGRLITVAYDPLDKKKT